MSASVTPGPAAQEELIRHLAPELLRLVRERLAFEDDVDWERRAVALVDRIYGPMWPPRKGK